MEPQTRITYFRHGKEFFLPTERVLFFEASDDNTYAHTRQYIYRVKFRLYEIEAILPDEFVRVSKSAVANVGQVVTFSSRVGTTGMVEFFGTHKRLHVSRKYIKSLRARLGSRSNYDN